MFLSINICLNEYCFDYCFNHGKQSRCYMKARSIVFLALTMLCILLYLLAVKYQRKVPQLTTQSCTHEQRENFLDDCQYIYIDIGTNIGIQIRKLYEPHLYPSAAVLPLFEQMFNNHTKEVCSVGFEANPVHDTYLKEFERYCLQRNWRVKIFTSTAVSIIEKNLTFYTEPGNEGNNQWGAGLDKGNKKANVIVPSINIISWFQNTVLTRRLSPDQLAYSRIMMKIDIEGHDKIVLANFLFHGIYCSIHLIYGEHFEKQFQNAISLLQRYTDSSCQTKLVYMDDESYHNKRFPFTVK